MLGGVFVPKFSRECVFLCSRECAFAVCLCTIISARKRMHRCYHHRKNCSGTLGLWGMVFLIILMQVCILLYLSRTINVFEAFKANLTSFYHFLSTHGWYVIGALAFLPTFGLPISPLWILAGVIWGLKLSLIIVALCLIFNLIFSYFFYQKCFNQLLYKWLLKKRNLTQLLHTDRLNSIKWCFLIQLMPQLPYTGQIYILSTVKEVNFWHYLSISWLFQFLWAAGFILGGNALKYGQWGLTIFGLILLVFYLTHKGFAYYKKLQ